LGFCKKVILILIFLDLIWVGVFLVLDHPTRRTLMLSKRFQRKILSKKLLFLNLITPLGLAQV
jgi:hypothetical protein